MKPTRLLTREQAVRTWHITVEPDQTLEDVMEPAFWCHVAKMMEPHQRIHVDVADGTWSAVLMVRDVAPHSVATSLEFHADMSEDVATLGDAADYKVEWAGPHHKNRVVRVSDNMVIKHGFAQKAEAEAWVRERAA